MFSLKVPRGCFANIQGPEAKLQVTVYSKQVQVSGGQGLVVNAKMEVSLLIFSNLGDGIEIGCTPFVASIL